MSSSIIDSTKVHSTRDSAPLSSILGLVKSHSTNFKSISLNDDARCDIASEATFIGAISSDLLFAYIRVVMSSRS